MAGKTRPGRDVLLAHTSDLHIDDEYTARQYGGDGTAGLRAVLEVAKAARADVVLLAGDTFDSHRLPDTLLERTAGTMREFGLPIVLLPGNHDPAIEEAVFHRPAFRKLDVLHVLGVTHEQAAHFPELGLEVWGRPHFDYFDMDPLAQVRERAARWHVAMVHGHYEPVPDRTVRPRASWLVGDDEIAASGADYVAFGHWNRRVRVGPSGIEAWYSGAIDYAGTINLVRLSPDTGISVEHAAVEVPGEVEPES